MATSPWISSVAIQGLHGHQTLRARFKSGLNIFYGKNGTGKTTLLHILANLMFHDLERFLELNFRTITIETSAPSVIQLVRTAGSPGPSIMLYVDGHPIQAILKSHEVSPDTSHRLTSALGPLPVYLPAFRTILDAVDRSLAGSQEYVAFRDGVRTDEDYGRVLRRVSMDSSFLTATDARRGRSDRAESIAYKTIFCRKWFGQFVPIIRYPALWEVSTELLAEHQGATFTIGQTDQKNLSKVFTAVLEALSKADPEGPPRGLSADIQNLRKQLDVMKATQHSLPREYDELRKLLTELESAPRKIDPALTTVLKVYTDVLQQRNQTYESAFRVLARFQESVNRFFERKRVDLTGFANPRRAQEFIMDVRRARHPVSTLSSGERHVFTLLFSATHMSGRDGVVLIDEPELSLHVDWQRSILSELQKQADGRQIIACTHAPEVLADHMDHSMELHLEFESDTDISTDDNSTSGA
ncbi:MAG: AAA family ATPase [Phycisphaerales bacterium]